MRRRPVSAAFVSNARSALAGLEAPLRLVDDVKAALAAHEAVVAMAAAQRFQRVTDFHGLDPWRARRNVRDLDGFLGGDRGTVNVATRLMSRPEFVAAAPQGAANRSGAFRFQRMGVVPPLWLLQRRARLEADGVPSTTARRVMGGASFHVNRWLTAIVPVVVGLALAVGAPSRAFAQEAELVLSKSGPASAAANTNVTYSLNLLSGGPDAATDVTVSDPLPSGMNFVSLACRLDLHDTSGRNQWHRIVHQPVARRGQQRELFPHHSHSEWNAGGHGLHQRRDGVQHDVRSDR